MISNTRLTQAGQLGLIGLCALSILLTMNSWGVRIREKETKSLIERSQQLLLDFCLIPSLDFTEEDLDIVRQLQSGINIGEPCNEAFVIKAEARVKPYKAK